MSFPSMWQKSEEFDEKLELVGQHGLGLEFLHDKQDRRIGLQNNLMATNDEVVFVQLLQHRNPQKNRVGNRWAPIGLRKIE